SSSGLTRDQSSKQKAENSNLEEQLPPVVTMADNRTMVELLRAPTEGYAEAIVVPPILAEQFELKHSLINMMTTDQFFGLEKDNPHNHIHQDSLNAAAGGNLLERSTQDVLTIIENKSKVRNSQRKPHVSQVKSCDDNSNSEIAKLTHAVNQQTSVVTTAMTAMLKQLQATLPPTSVKAVEEIYFTYGGAHPYYQCLTTGGNTFPEFGDNIQGYASAAAVNYNQGNPGYRPQGTQIDMVKNELRNEMKSSIQTSLSNQTNEIKNMMASILQMNTASTSSSSTLPSNTIANPKGDLKAITTRSGASYDGPSILPPVVENEPEATKDTVNPTNNGTTEDVQPQAVQSKPVTFEPANTPVSALKPNPKASIPYPSRRNVERNREKDKDQIEKFYQILKDMSFEISFSDALILMPNMAKCSALADLGASINLMPYFVWKKLSLPELTPTYFIVVDFDADPRVPLILERSFLKTKRALIDVFEGELTLRVGKKSITFNLDQTLRYSAIYNDMTAKHIDVIDMASEEYSQEVLGFSDTISSGNPTTCYDLIISATSSTLTPFGNSDFLLEESLGQPCTLCTEKGGFTIVENEENELIPLHLVTGWRVCIVYCKLNEATRKDHFPLPFMDQMLERLAGNQNYCFLDGFSGYFQIHIDPKDQEKTTFTCPYGTFNYRCMPFGLCNAPGTFQRCMMAIFHDMIKKTMEVFMDDFSVFGNSFQSCLSHLEKMLKRAVGHQLPQKHAVDQVKAKEHGFESRPRLGKTAGHDRPRHPSIQTFLTDKIRLVTSAREKKKCTPLLIPSIRFTKLIIHHLITKHYLHPRTGSPLYYPHEDHALGILRSVGKDGREIFGMPMPDALLTDAIKIAPYYGRYQAHVVKYQKYLEEECTHFFSTTQTTPAPTESTKIVHGKKCKLVKETSNAPSPAKRLKPGKVKKNRISKSTLKLVDEFVDEGFPVKEPAYLDEEVDIQRALRTSKITRPSGDDKYPSLDVKPELADNTRHLEAEETTEEQIREEFTSTMYLNVQDTLKLPVEEQIIHEEHASSIGTIVSLPQLDKDFNFSDQFLNDKSSDADKEKTHAEAEFESMVTVTIQQDTSSIPLMQFKVGYLPIPRSNDPNVHSPTPSTTLVAKQAPLRARFSDLLAIDMKEILQQRMFEENSYQAHEDHKNLYEALHKSLERDYSNQLLADLDEARRKKRKKRNSPRTPSGSPPQQPPPPPLTGASSAPGTSGASGSSQPPPPPPPSSTITSRGNHRQGSGAPSSFKTAASAPEISNKSATLTPPPTDTLMRDDSTLDIQVHLSDDEASRDDHLPKAGIRKDWLKPLPEAERPDSPEPTWTIPSSNMIDVENNWATELAFTYAPPAKNSLLAKTRDMTTFMNWYCQQVNKTIHTQEDHECQAYKFVKAFHPYVVHLRPLPLVGPPCHVIIQTQLFFNKDLDYLRYGNKGSRSALSISKRKVACYPDFGLELLVPNDMWISELYQALRKSELTCVYLVLSEYKPSLATGRLDHLSGSDKRMLSTAANLWKLML
nr:reverse transcriptase domain-containing protein [Tanacetum cinerariifolium]